MKLSELTAALHERAEQLDVTPPSARIVRDWIDRGILPRSQAAGGGGRGKPPEWVFPDVALDIGRRVLELRKIGARRTTEFVVMLWLDGHDYDEATLKHALAKEIDGISKRHFPDGYPAWTNTAHREASPKVSDRQRRQLGKGDPRIAPFAPASEDSLKLTALSVSAYPGEFDEGRLIADILKSLLPSSAAMFDDLPHSFGLSGSLARPVDDATPSQNAERIAEASLDELLTARDLYQFLRSTFQSPETLNIEGVMQLSDEQQKSYTAAAYSLNATPWAMYVFSLVVKHVHGGLIDGEIAAAWRRDNGG